MKEKGVVWTNEAEPVCVGMLAQVQVRREIQWWRGGMGAKEIKKLVEGGF